MSKEISTHGCDFSGEGGKNMSKRKETRIRRTAAVLLSAVLITGMLCR